jgi:hypothetical protein
MWPSLKNGFKPVDRSKWRDAIIPPLRIVPDQEFQNPIRLICRHRIDVDVH